MDSEVDDLIGALNVYSRSAGAFDDDIRAGQTFAAYAAIAVANADSFASTAEMAENLRVAMASGATIEQAKGVLMALGSRCWRGSPSARPQAPRRRHRAGGAGAATPAGPAVAG